MFWRFQRYHSDAFAMWSDLQPSLYCKRHGQRDRGKLVKIGQYAMKLSQNSMAYFFYSRCIIIAIVSKHKLKQRWSNTVGYQLCPIHTADADATHLSSWVASTVCTEFATSRRQFRRVGVWTNLPTAKSSCVAQVAWTHSIVGSGDPVYISCAVELLRLMTSDEIMTSLLKKLSISIKIYVIKLLCSVSKLSTESVGSRRELVANSVHTAVADATRSM